MVTTPGTYETRARKTHAWAQAAATAEMRVLLHELAATYERIAQGYALIAWQEERREENERAKTHHNQAGWPPSG